MRTAVTFSQRSKGYPSETGVAITECAIALLFLVPLLMGIVDLGRAIGTYIQLTQIAHEGVRLAAGLPNLEEGTFTSSVAWPVNQASVLHRVDQLMDWNNLNVKPGSIVITSSYTPRALDPGASTPNDDTVLIQVSAEYEPIFSIFRGLAMNVRAQGPYLYDRSTV